MIEHYQVSRQTVREAVRHLEQDGLVVRHRGRGTILSHSRFEQRLGSIYSLFRELERCGYQQNSKVLFQGSVIDEALACQFQLTDDNFFYLERLRYAGALEVAHDKVHIPMSYAKPLLNVAFEHTFLYDELELRCHISPTSGEERFSPIVLPPSESELLGCKSPSAALSIRRVTYFGAAQLEVRDTIVRGDRYWFVSSFDSAKTSNSTQLSQTFYS